jgi:hypothetical protein
MGSLKIFLYENNRTRTLLEEFYINKFEDLEKKIYGNGKDLIICVRTNPLDENTNTTLFQFDAQENSPNGNFNSPNDSGRYWAFLEDYLHDFLADFKFIKLYPDDSDKEIELERKFIEKKKLDIEDRRELAKNFIGLFLFLCIY